MYTLICICNCYAVENGQKFVPHFDVNHVVRYKLRYKTRPKFGSVFAFKKITINIMILNNLSLSQV